MQLLTSAQIKLAFLSRFVVAVVLVLALLSGIAPFKSAAAGSLCTMSCCAGLPPHAAGSCHMDMSHGKSEGALPDAGTGPIKGVSAGVMGMTTGANSSLDFDSVTIDASEHCYTNAQADSATPSRSDSSQPASVAPQSFSKPCPPECGTGALSLNVRPSRRAVVLAHNARPRPPTLVRKYRQLDSNFLTASAHCKQVGPRGPPQSIS